MNGLLGKSKLEERHQILVVSERLKWVRSLAEQCGVAGMRLHHAAGLPEALSFRPPTSPSFVIVDIDDEANVESIAPQIGDLCGSLPQARTMALIGKENHKFEDLLRHAGISEFMPRAISVRHLAPVIIRYCDIRRIEDQNQRYRLLQESRNSFENLLGGSVPMRALYRLIEQVSRADAPVLIIGEEGSEFYEVAYSIHERSSRRRGALVVVDCAEIVAEDQEAEIFGPAGEGINYPLGPCPEKSAFASAGKGTLLVNHIEFATPNIQARLLNFFHQPYYQGETLATPQPIARIIAASAANLDERVEAGEFNRELYYRLNILRACIPPLRERREDIPILAEHYLQSLTVDAESNSVSIPSLSSDALLQLFQYPWPGNVQELEIAVQEAATRTKSQQIAKEHLPVTVQCLDEEDESGGVSVRADVPMKLAKRAFEAEYFRDLLTRTNGNMTLASRTSKVGRPYLYKKLKEHDIEPDDFR